MIRRWLSTGGRGGVVLAVAAWELALAWLLGLAATSSAASTLSRHPHGALALYEQGGRPLGELVALHAPALEPAAALIAVAVFANALAWMLLGGVFPVLGATPGVRWYRAAAESLRRAPTLLALAAIVGVGYGVAGFAGYAATGWAARTASTRLDVRAMGLLGVAGWAFGLGLAWLLGVWHDVARTHAMVRAQTAMQASGAAAAQMVREPIATMAAAVGFGLVGAAYVVIAATLAGLIGQRAGWAPVVALLVVQHLAVLGRVHARMKWFSRLGARAS